MAVKIEPISANEGCTRLWKSEIHFDGIFEGLGVQPLYGPIEGTRGYGREGGINPYKERRFQE